MRNEYPEDFPGDAVDTFFQETVKAGNNTLDLQPDIFFSVTQRREMQPDDIDPVIQIAGQVLRPGASSPLLQSDNYAAEI